MKVPSATRAGVRCTRPPSAAVFALGLIALAGCRDPLGSGPAQPLLQVAAGGRHACGLDAGGNGYCWGRGEQGQLGDGGSAERSRPVPVSGGHRFVSLSAGDYHTCGITADGTAYCWGAASRDIADGQLGNGSLSNGSREPVRVRGGISFTSLSAGLAHSCGVAKDGRAYCWGHNRDGQLGDGSVTSRSAPVAVLGNLRFRSLDAGRKHSCGVAADGVVHCWGTNLTAQLGHASRDVCELGTPCSVAPRPIDTAERFSTVTAGEDHSCGIATSGRASCWGANPGGALGTGDTISGRSPRGAAGELRFASIDAGTGHTCAVTAAGAAYCWGNRELGQLGSLAPAAGCGAGRDFCSAVPLPVEGSAPWRQLTTGVHFTCGSGTAGAYCWGWNRESQLGVPPRDVQVCRGGDQACSMLPVRVSGQEAR